MQAWAEVIRRTDSILYVSTATLAEITDGTSTDAQVRRAVKAVRLVDVAETVGYRAGALRAQAKGRRKARDLTVDALVAATALDLAIPVLVLTSDPRDLRLLLEGSGVAVVAI